MHFSFVFIAVLSGVLRAENAVFVEEAAKLRSEFGLSQYASKNTQMDRVKVAVLDNGFAGINSENPGGAGDLPPKTFLKATYQTPTLALDPSVEHGARTARIIYSMTDKNPDLQMGLFNAHGQTAFGQAMKAARDWGASIIYCGFTLPTLGNFGGDGEVDAAIDDAVANGILFISPAGNYGGMVYNGPIQFFEPQGTKGEKWVSFVVGDQARNYLRFKNNFDENEFTITVSWRFGAGQSATRGTQQDLKLLLALGEGEGKEQEYIVSADKRQVVDPDGNSDTSLLSMEQISKRKLKAYKNREYRIWVKQMGGTFDARDRIRVSIEASKPDGQDRKTGKVIPSVEFLDSTDNGEIMVVADSRGIAVGDFSSHSSRGPTRDGRSKPDLFLEKNAVRFSDLNSFAGNTISSALFAGIVTQLKAYQPLLAQRHLLALRSKSPDAFLKKEGWRFGSLANVPYMIREKLQTVFNPGELAIHSEDALLIGSRVSLSRLDLYKEVPDWVKNDSDNYAVYLYVQETAQAAKWVKDPYTQKWIPPREEILRPAVPGKYENVVRYETDRKLVGAQLGMDIYGRLAIYGTFATTQTPHTDRKWVPGEAAQTRTIPGFYQPIQGKWRWQPQEPKREVRLTWQNREPQAGHKAPWEQEGKAERSRADFFELRQIKLPRADGKGLVSDGSDAEPKYWKTPTPSELKAMVGTN